MEIDPRRESFETYKNFTSGATDFIDLRTSELDESERLRKLYTKRVCRI